MNLKCAKAAFLILKTSHLVELFCGMIDWWKTLYFQPGPLPEILTIANVRHAASRIWTCAEPDFRFFWMKLRSSDNHYTTTPIHEYVLQHKNVFFFSERLSQINMMIRHIKRFIQNPVKNRGWCFFGGK